LQIIGQIFAVKRGDLSLRHLFEWTPKLGTTKFDVNKLETAPYRMYGMKYISKVGRASDTWEKLCIHHWPWQIMYCNPH